VPRATRNNLFRPQQKSDRFVFTTKLRVVRGTAGLLATAHPRSAFAFRSPAPALAAGLPRQNHVYSTIDESCRFHNDTIR